MKQRISRPRRISTEPADPKLKDPTDAPGLSADSVRLPARDPGPQDIRDAHHAIAAKAALLKRRVSTQARRFLVEYAVLGFQHAEIAGKRAGFKYPSTAHRLVAKFADLIEAEKLKLRMADLMTVDEALKRVAGLARAAEDPKLQHAALRTILEVEGALTKDRPMTPNERADLQRQAEEIIGGLKKRLHTLSDKKRAMLAAEIAPNAPREVIDVTPNEHK